MEGEMDVDVTLLNALLSNAVRISEQIRDISTTEHTRIKADAIARQLRELVKEAKELS